MDTGFEYLRNIMWWINDDLKTRLSERMMERIHVIESIIKFQSFPEGAVESAIPNPQVDIGMGLQNVGSLERNYYRNYRSVTFTWKHEGNDVAIEVLDSDTSKIVAVGSLATSEGHSFGLQEGGVGGVAMTCRAWLRAMFMDEIYGALPRFYAESLT